MEKVQLILNVSITSTSSLEVKPGLEEQYNQESAHTLVNLLNEMASVQDSRIFGNVLSTRESAKIWSDEQRTAYHVAFEIALAKVQAKLGIIPQKVADEVEKRCGIECIDLDELRRQTEIIGYPILGTVKQLVKQINQVEPGLGEWIHWGATTQV